MGSCFRINAIYRCRRDTRTAAMLCVYRLACTRIRPYASFWYGPARKRLRGGTCYRCLDRVAAKINLNPRFVKECREWWGCSWEGWCRIGINGRSFGGCTRLRRSIGVPKNVGSISRKVRKITASRKGSKILEKNLITFHRYSLTQKKP
jgi:hypothetical protein